MEESDKNLALRDPFRILENNLEESDKKNLDRLGFSINMEESDKQSFSFSSSKISFYSEESDSGSFRALGKRVSASSRGFESHLLRKRTFAHSMLFDGALKGAPLARRIPPPPHILRPSY